MLRPFWSAASSVMSAAATGAEAVDALDLRAGMVASGGSVLPLDAEVLRESGIGC
jgi:hypothetical protein